MTTRLEAFYIGVDLGRRISHSAIVVAAMVRHFSPHRNPATYEYESVLKAELCHVERVRLEEDYLRVLGRLTAVTKRLGVAHPGVDVNLVIDSAGPGPIAVEIVRAAGLDASVYPLVITGGDQPNQLKDGTQSVPRRDLITALRYAAELGRLTMAENLEWGPALIAEAAAVQYGASQQKEHDDLVLAAAMAVWKANRRNPELLRPAGRQYVAQGPLF